MWGPRLMCIQSNLLMYVKNMAVELQPLGDPDPHVLRGLTYLMRLGKSNFDLPGKTETALVRCLVRFEHFKSC